MEWLHSVELAFEAVVECSVLILEVIGVMVLLIGALRAAHAYAVQHKRRMQLDFASAMSVGLQFLLCGEIISTLVARDWKNILVIGVIMVIRAAVGFLLHWESGHLRHEIEHEEGKSA